jgi:hypothetical protein
MIETVLRTLLIGACAVAPLHLSAQDPPQQTDGHIRVFLDCSYLCDLDFFRREIMFVDYVRDRQDADVHVLVTSRQNGSGGQDYEISFMGLGDYAGVEGVQRYSSSSTDTRDEERRGLAQQVTFGLMEFVGRSAIAGRIHFTLRPSAEGERTGAQPEDDPWNFWVFTIHGSGSVNGQSARDGYRVSGSLTANRVTEDWKLNLRANGSYSRTEYELSDSDPYLYTSRSYGANGLLVRSVTDHWSLGARASASISTYNNEDLRLRTGPAVEYNIFPYDESSRRQLTFQYSVGINAVNYEEETIYEKTEEILWEHSLATNLSFVQPWGQSSVVLEGSQFLNDLSKNRITLFASTRVRLVRGLDFNLSGHVSRVRDQLSLPREGASDEEILLRRKQLETSYEFGLAAGFSFRFGSIYNNVVNPRFGGGGMHIFFF